MKDNTAEIKNNKPIDFVNIDSFKKVSIAKISLDFKFFHKEKIKIKPPETAEANNKKRL